MRKIKKSLLVVMCSLLLIVPAAQSVIVRAPTVSERIAPTQIFSEECHREFFGCMGQFCDMGNFDGGSCACSDVFTEQQARMTRIGEINDQAEQIRNVEVERVRAGAAADIIFGDGTRQFDARGNVVTDTERQTAAQRAADRRARLDNLRGGFTMPTFSDGPQDITQRTGDSLQLAAREICIARMPANCARDIELLTQLYATQVRDDCAGFVLAVNELQTQADANLAQANADVRAARGEMLATANRLGRGQCTMAFRECMQGPQVCGTNWTECVQFAAADAMVARQRPTQQRNITQISLRTMDRINARRHACDHILDECIAVRNYIWDDFLVSVAPDLVLAERRTESNMRQSCMRNITECVMGDACRDFTQGPDSINIDACLSRDGAIVRATCAHYIDPCMAMEPAIWDYVLARLRAMGTDRCMEEVHRAFTRPFPMGCGEDFVACAGVDLDFMRDMVPMESLVVCNQMFSARGEQFTMDDLDRLLLGLYLNVDNAAIENCQDLIDAELIRICGSTGDCNRFAADEFMGTGSLRPQKSGNVYRVTGMISFGQIRMGDSHTDALCHPFPQAGCLPAGEIDVERYITEVRTRHASRVAAQRGITRQWENVWSDEQMAGARAGDAQRALNDEGIIENIEAELRNIAGTINRTIELISGNPHVQACVFGRDLSQITGQAGQTTQARFPNLLNNTRMLIAAAALRQAQDNYNRKFSEAVAEATRNASLDLAQFMCQRVAEAGGGDMSSPTMDSTLAEPFAIAFEIAAGLDNQYLLRGGAGVSQAGGMSMSLRRGGNRGVTASGGGVTTNTTALFNRETRTCRICRTHISEDCAVEARAGWFRTTSSTNCTPNVHPEQCQDIRM